MTFCLRMVFITLLPKEPAQSISQGRSECPRKEDLPNLVSICGSVWDLTHLPLKEQQHELILYSLVFLPWFTIFSFHKIIYSTMICWVLNVLLYDTLSSGPELRGGTIYLTPKAICNRFCIHLYTLVLLGHKEDSIIFTWDH